MVRETVCFHVAAFLDCLIIVKWKQVRKNIHFVLCTFDPGSGLHSLVWQKKTISQSPIIKPVDFAQNFGS